MRERSAARSAWVAAANERAASNSARKAPMAGADQPRATMAWDGVLVRHPSQARAPRRSHLMPAVAKLAANNNDSCPSGRVQAPSPEARHDTRRRAPTNTTPECRITVPLERVGTLARPHVLVLQALGRLAPLLLRTAP